MQDKRHSYQSHCRLAPIPATDRQDGVPPVQAQFFYSSSMTIDDPFWAKPNTSSADKKSGKGLLRPFAQGDNNMLERAWIALTSTEDRKRHQDVRTRKLQESELKQETANKRQLIINNLAAKHAKRHQKAGSLKQTANSIPVNDEDEATAYCRAGLLADVNRELRKHFCSMVREIDTSLDPEAVTQDITDLVARRHSEQSRQREHGGKTSVVRPLSRQGKILASDSPNSTPPQGLRYDIAKSAGRASWAESEAVSRSRSISQVTYGSSRTHTPMGSLDARQSAGKDGITGKPFVRVEDPNERRGSASSPKPAATTHATDKEHSDEEPTNLLLSDEITDEDAAANDSCDIPASDSLVTVGASKLHMVVLPDLQMKPIYWSPVNDVAAVSRATWFYRDTMLPVSSIVANQLEAGYQDLRPWSTTWGEELNCALKVGADGEEKVSYDLWPQEHKTSRQKSRTPKQPTISSELYCASHCFESDAAAHGSIEPIPEESAAPSKPFAAYQVVYKDSRHAFLLKPSLKASEYYGRRPVSRIMRGFTVGIPVVRGFDRKAWDRLRGTGKGSKASNEQNNVNETDEEEEPPTECPACEEEKDRGQITDLVLVAHGIGQKLADRVESFHFTHAINSFRRSVNLDLKNPVVQKVLREDLNGLMILPLNWRMGVSFEDGGPQKEQDGAAETDGSFSLKDIEPDTIPAVRSMMSDVMFDIPFYMSHHKSKMITALVSEANRVYRLWCRNNPGFAEKGRVHLIAHSLGSVMTVDILSRQPTRVRADPLPPQINTEFFEFDTTNLFLAGSPVGFFLLLEKGKLIPRRGRKKPGADVGDSTSGKVSGEAGTFGCIAVDNVYNILAKEDPIAYLLTGAVDPKYAAGLKTAYVPSTVSSMMKSMGNAMRQVIPGMAPAADPFAVEPERPLTARLPSQLELEVHNFTREEIAEKKAFLLNDNGQIDWFLRSGGGPLEIQYLNMLSAHTSYWTNNDFIRLVCLEIGRNPGRSNTLPAMRAAKLVKRTPVIAKKP